jgi:phage tail-like protein
VAEAEGNGSAGSTSYFYTAAGRRRRLFSTRSLRVPEATADNGAGRPRHSPDPPPVARTRRIYRSRLPAIYHKPPPRDFGIRFVGALESSLDPLLALLDSLAAHFEPDLAPQDVLELLAGWLGVELDESWPDERRRDLVRRAGELSRLRGTRAGFELALSVAYPDLPLRIEDGGGIVYGEAARADAATSDGAGFVVYCDEPLAEDVLTSVARLIERVKPVHVTYRLRVKTRRPEA